MCTRPTLRLPCRTYHAHNYPPYNTHPCTFSLPRTIQVSASSKRIVDLTAYAPSAPMPTQLNDPPYDTLKYEVLCGALAVPRRFPRRR